MKEKLITVRPLNYDEIQMGSEGIIQLF